MIVKNYETPGKAPKDARRTAGHDAEQQMAHYLAREFESASDVAVLHGLRLVDDTRTDVGGGPMVAQIDHLVLHRCGALIVESKSCAGSVKIAGSSSGRDEWTIMTRREKRWRGMPSPIQQANRQAQVLRRVLQGRRDEVLGKALFGLMQ
ncbi:MAG: nuclease-related domain-containing protein, partial [Planctomycetota bacterium]